MDRGESTRLQPYLKNYRELREDGNRRSGLYQGGPHLLVIQYQAVNPQNIYTGSFIWTYQVIFRNIYICVHM